MDRSKKSDTVSRKIKYKISNRKIKGSGESEGGGFGTRPIPTRYPGNKSSGKAVIKRDDKYVKINRSEK